MKHDIKVGDVWKANGSDCVLKILFNGLVNSFIEIKYDNENHYYERGMHNITILEDFTLIERNGKPVIKIPQGGELLGALCGVSNESLATAESRAKDMKDLNVVFSYNTNDKVYITAYGDRVMFAYPVDTSKLKQWSPDNA